VLKTAAQAILRSAMYAGLADKPVIDFSVPQSTEDTLRFINAAFGTAFAKAVWTVILQYGVPMGVVRLLFKGRAKKEQREILKVSIELRRDANDNLMFVRSDLYDLEQFIITGLPLSAAQEVASPPTKHPRPNDEVGATLHADDDAAHPAASGAADTAGTPVLRIDKRQRR